jgi:GTPase SAR1 family protein
MVFTNDNTSSSYYYQVHGSKVVQTNEGRVAVTIYNDALLEDHQRKWRPETRYNRTYDIILVFFDITNRRSFESLKDNIKYEKRWDMRENLFFIIIGTKADLSYKRVISKEKAEQFARNLGFPYMETSALTGENVEETFALAVEIALTAKLHDISMSEAARWLQNIRFEIKPDEPQPETNTTSKCLVM